MSSTRSELDAALYQLHAALPLWRDVMQSDEAIRQQYGEKLADIVSDVPPKHRRYAVEQASNLMAAVAWR